MLKLSFALLLGAGAVVACSVDSANMAAPPCSGLNCAPGDLNSSEDSALQGRLPGMETNQPPAAPAKEACGVGSCLPDNVAACDGYSPPAEPVTPGNAEPPTSDDVDHSDRDAGPISDAGGGDAGPTTDGGLDAGAPTPNVDGSFARPTQPNVAPGQFACQLLLNDDAKVVRGCGVSGARGIDESCTSSADCAAGLGCVGMMRSGRCLPFCCAIDGDDSCGEGSYCVERPLRSETLGPLEGPAVPVCDRADNCNLGEPHPCEGQDCVCGPETACTLVRPNGTTACRPPGNGETGDRCPCKAGFHCSQATEPASCVRTCDLDDTESSACSPGVCQATPALPMGWGTCVGAAPDEKRTESSPP